MEVAAVVEETAGAWEDWVVFVATLWRCARSLEKFGTSEELLDVLAGGGQEGQRARLLRWYGMLNSCLSG